MTKLKPHQRPILTRLAFVMPVCRTASPMLHGQLVPCEPEQAEGFRVIQIDPRNGAMTINAIIPVSGPNGPRSWKKVMAEAQDSALQLDARLAEFWELPR